MRGRTRRNCPPGLIRPWRGRSATRPSGPVTGSVGRLPETLALAAILHLPATPPHSPQPEYALASLCTKWSSLSFASLWSGRCGPFLVILDEIVLVVLHMLVFVLFYRKSIRSSSRKSSVLCFLLLFCPGHGPPSALPANCPGFLHPSGTAGGGCGMGTLTPAPRSRWLCVRVAPYCGAPRLTSLVAGTTPSRVVRVRIAVGICYQGPRCPTRHPPRGSWPAPCQLLIYCFLARAPAQLSPA